MNIMKSVLACMFFTLLLSACEDSGDPDSDDSVGSSYPTTTNATNGCDDEGIGLFIDMECFTLSTTTVDPAINSGKFTAKWDVTTRGLSPDPTTLSWVKFYVSKDKVYDSGVDIEIYQDFNANKTRTVPCAFSSDNVMTCGTFFVQPVDLTTWLTSLPLDAYILARSCINLGTSCDTESVLVTFQ